MVLGIRYAYPPANSPLPAGRGAWWWGIGLGYRDEVHPRDRIAYRAEALKRAGLWREPAAGEAVVGDGRIDTRSNDYLGLAARAVSRETAFHADGRLGAGASRLVSGTWPEHLALESDIADWLGTEACLLFSSGYAANVGALSSLVGPGETVISDALNHASIIDGCRLSRAQTVVVPHANTSAVERALADTHGVRWVVVESYYSMDADTPNLRALRELCDRHDAALIVDEAHAIGVFGPRGRGLCAELGVAPDVLVGGLGKAIGGHGGFVATSQLYRDWLWNRARSMVFSTGTSPVLGALTRERLRAIQSADEERALLQSLNELLEKRLIAGGVQLPSGRRGPIFPIPFGTEAAVLRAAALTADAGVVCQPIRPPTVPPGGSRLRVSLRASMTTADVNHIGDALIGAWAATQHERTSPATNSGRAHVPPPSVNSLIRGAAGALGVPAIVPQSAPNLDASQARSMTALAPLADGPVGTWEHSPAAAGPGDTRAAPLSDPERRPSTDGDTREPRRCVVLGTGTGVGKTYVSRALVRLYAQRAVPVAGLKPVETGLAVPDSDLLSDSAVLERTSFHVKHPSPHPLYGFRDPVTPALAARREANPIELASIEAWIAETASLEPGSPPYLVVETAGGVFSPLSDTLTNLDLAHATGAGLWVLVASDRLGVLHDVASTLHAMRHHGRRPDYLVLSAPEVPDASTTTNAQELRRMTGMPPIIELPRNDIDALAPLLDPRVL